MIADEEHLVMIQTSFVLLKEFSVPASSTMIVYVFGWFFQKSGLKELINTTSPPGGILVTVTLMRIVFILDHMLGLEGSLRVSFSNLYVQGL